MLNLNLAPKSTLNGIRHVIRRWPGRHQRGPQVDPDHSDDDAERADPYPKAKVALRVLDLVLFPTIEAALRALLSVFKGLLG